MDYFDLQLQAEQERREHLEDQWAVEWDMTQAEIEKAIQEFGWDRVHRFVCSLRPKGFTGTLPDGTKVVDGLSIN